MMSTFANRPNNSATAPMSESDNDDDNEQNSSFNQQNESMIHKVKDVVSKLLHPSFLFSTSTDTTRPKRKRIISTEENGDEKQSEPTTTATNIISNGHSTKSKSKHLRQPNTDDEPQLTDDEDSNGRDVISTEQDLSQIEQQKKRRRTANYQQIISTTTTTNGNHEDDRTSPPITSMNSVGSLSSRRIVDNGFNTANTTPVLLQTSSTEQNHNEETNRLTSSKQRFNISSTTRSLTPNYDLSQSPLFSVGVRKNTETTMSPNRTTTNLKSNTNDFSGNFLLATGLVNRSQSTVQNTSQSSTSTSTNRLLSTERQMLGVNYASINSRRLPYIERLRRRTLQDCIRLNRTLDSEPLSISTIEEHTSTTASPIRKPTKALEKECGIQCNISTTDSSMEPSKKIQRTFPPLDIRNEALTVPTIEKVQSNSQTDSSIQTNSTITIEPIRPTYDINKPKVLGNITPFSWPKFARAQEEYAKKHPEKCRADAVPTQAPKPTTTSSIVEKPTVNNTFSTGLQTSANNTTSKMPIFSVSPPRPTKPISGPIWKCPSCSMEHPAQTASCSLCHGINPNYKRLSALESTPASTPAVPTSKIPDTIVEEYTPATTTKESTFSIPSVVTTTAPSTTATTFSGFGTAPITTKENTIINPPVTTTVPFPPTSTPLFGTSTTITTPTPAATLDKPVTSTPNTLFQFGASNPPAFQSFGSLAPTTTATTSAASTSTTPSLFATPNATITTPIPSSPIKASITFGTFGSTPSATTPATTTISSAISTDKPPQFSFGTSAPSLSVTSLSSSTANTSSTTPNLFGFPSNTTAPPIATTTTAAATSLPLPISSSTTSGFSFPSAFPLVSTSIATTTTTPATTSAAPLFGSGLSSSSSGFSFPSANTTTTTSSSTPFAFGASSPPKPFAPSVISTSNTTSIPTFGATASFGAVPTTTDKPSTSGPSFSAFGSTGNTSSLFSFGATSNTTTNLLQPTTAPTNTTSGFAFSASSSSSTAAAPPAFGSTAPTFAFGSTPSFSFGGGGGGGGGGSTGSSSNAPFQFSGSPSPAPVTNTFSPSFPPTSSTPDNNPFSVSEEATAKRHVIKAKRRAKP